MCSIVKLQQGSNDKKCASRGAGQMLFWWGNQTLLFLTVAIQPFPPSECYDYDIEYSPYELLIKAVSGMRSITDCQAECQREPACEHFVYMYV